jgi:hypothetical protein
VILKTNIQWCLVALWGFASKRERLTWCRFVHVHLHPLLTLIFVLSFFVYKIHSLAVLNNSLCLFAIYICFQLQWVYVIAIVLFSSIRCCWPIWRASRHEICSIFFTQVASSTVLSTNIQLCCDFTITRDTTSNVAIIVTHVC